MDQKPGRSDSQFQNLSSSRIVMEPAVSPTPVTRTPTRTDPKDKPRRFDAPNRLEIITGIIVALFLLGFPWLNPGYRILSLSITTAFTAVALYGLALQFGQAGIMSVGHSAVMGIGAYTAAILATKLGVGFWLALPLSALLSALVAGLIGLPTLRVSGQHYIIITFCFCALLVIALTNGGSFTGAATGLDVGSIDPIFGISFDRLKNAYYLVIVALLLCIFAYYLIANSSYGRTLRAIRENEPLARAVGIKTGFHKIGVLMVSGAFAGVAGILQAYYLHHIAPNLYGAFPSLYLALMVMLGGPRLLYGPLLGAIIVNFLPEIMHLDPIDSRIAYGISLLVVILLLPGGVSAGLLRIYRWVARSVNKSDRNDRA
jgi:branched-chain amino acid transport system permease protein